MDLADFPPVCLPSPGQSFEGSDGTIAGENLTRSPASQVPQLTWLYTRGSGNLTSPLHDSTPIPSILSNWVLGRLGID